MKSNTWPIEEVVGRNVLAFRVALGISQQELGSRLEPYLGRSWTRQAVSTAEKGGRDFVAAELVALACVLGTSIPALVLPGQDGEIKLRGSAVLTREQLGLVLLEDAALGQTRIKLSVLSRALHDLAVRAEALSSGNSETLR